MTKLTVKPARVYLPGFTLVEIIIVVMIIAIAAAIVGPMMSSAGSVQVRAAANMIAADLEYAKSMAITMQQNHRVVFDAANETYQIQDSSGTVIDHPVEVGSDYSVDFGNDGRLDRVDIVSADFDGNEEVEFDYLGRPYDSGGNSLNSGVIRLAADGVTMTVNVGPVTGYISIN